jgi:hypothetical protein
MRISMFADALRLKALNAPPYSSTGRARIQALSAHPVVFQPLLL